MPGFAISPRGFASLRCERQAALVMRTIRRQVYARDRHLALLQLRQGKCRCAVTVRTSAGCPRRGCSSPILRTFRPVVAKISRKPYCGSSIPGFFIAPFLILRCNENYMPSQQDFDWRGMTGGDLATAWRPLEGTAWVAERGAQSLTCQGPIC